MSRRPARARRGTRASADPGRTRAAARSGRMSVRAARTGRVRRAFWRKALPRRRVYSWRVALSDDLERIADAAATFAAPDERVTGVVAAEPLGSARLYLCAYESADGHAWLALDDDGRPVGSRRLGARRRLARRPLRAGGGDGRRRRPRRPARAPRRAAGHRGAGGDRGGRGGGGGARGHDRARAAGGDDRLPRRAGSGRAAARAGARRRGRLAVRGRAAAGDAVDRGARRRGRARGTRALWRRPPATVEPWKAEASDSRSGATPKT